MSANDDGNEERTGLGAMHPILNHLTQLQELTVARAQQAASAGGARLLGELDGSINALMEALPLNVGTLYGRLAKKDIVVLAPISHNVCSACGMALPVSLVQSVRQAQALYYCPNCARILYYPEMPLRSRAQRQPRFSPAKTGVSRFSAPGLMLPRMGAASHDEVLAALCQVLEEQGFVEDAGQLTEAALRREVIASTAVDNGLAFPHVRGVEGGGLTMAVATSRKGIRFGGPGRSLTRIFFFMVIPTAASAFYLRLLSGLTQTFRDKERGKKLLEAETPEDLWKTLLKLTRTTVR